MKIQGIRSHRFLPLAIQFYMWLWVPLENSRRFKYNLLHKDKKPYVKFQKTNNHWSLRSVRLGLEWEALWPKIVERPFILNHHEVSEWDRTCSIEKENEIVAFLREQVDKHYETFNFWWHIVKVFTGKWYGPTGDSQHSCVEIINKVLMMLGEPVTMDFNPFETQEYLGKPDFHYHADNQSTIQKFVSWLLDRSTYITIGIIVIVILYLAITGGLFKDIIIRSYF